MTQVVRQKWLVGLGAVNAALALLVIGIVWLAAGEAKRGAREEAAAGGAELRVLRAELLGMRDKLDELRAASQRKAAERPERPERDDELARTLQAIASEQQLLLLRSLQPPPAPVKKAAARRRPRRRPAATGCPVR